MKASDPPRTPSRKPRVWSALVVFLGTVPIVLVTGELLRWLILPADADGEALKEALTRPGSFLVFLVTSQLVYGAGALIAAGLSPVPWRERLGLVPPRTSAGTLPLLMIATLFVWQAGAFLWSLCFREPSEQLQLMSRAFLEATGLTAFVLVAAGSLLPGVFEELLCRGYVQSRLQQRWPSVVAVSFTSLGFAAMHFDLQHVVGVLPVAFWLGYVALRTGSTWPGIACHAFMNAVALAVGRVQEGMNPVTVGALLLLLLGLSGPIFFLSILRLERTKLRSAPSTAR